MNLAARIISSTAAVLGLLASLNLQPWGFSLLIFAIWLAIAVRDERKG